MSEPRIVFPCDYPIKVVGDTRPDFQEDLFEVFVRHDPTMTISKVSRKYSREGKYVSITFMMLATSERQIKALFADLKTIESVKLVL